MSALPAGCRRNDGVDQIDQLAGMGKGLFFPLRNDFFGDGIGEALLAEFPENAGQTFGIPGIEKIGGGGALPAHAHIQRGIHAVGKAPLGVIQLIGGDPQVQQDAVHPGYPLFRQHLRD